MPSSTIIDISAAVNQRAGIGRYARELTRELIPLLPLESTGLWMALDRHPFDRELPRRNPWNTLPTSQSPISRRTIDRLARARVAAPARLLGVANPLDAYSPDFTSPPAQREHVTIHDLAWLHPEASTPPGIARYLTPVVERAVRTAVTVFTVSDAIRAEIVEQLKVDPERIVVAPDAPADHFFRAVTMSQAELVTLGIRTPFLLCVGTIEPRKNLPPLFHALRRLPADLQLVLVGQPGWRADEQLEPIRWLGLNDRVRRLGYVDDATLARLYASTASLVYVSRYEGFGLPIVEGLAAGAPVVASNLEVFREVGGELVTYVDPQQPESIAAAIKSQLSSVVQATDARQLRQKRAGRYDWRTSAEIVARRLQGG